VCSDITPDLRPGGYEKDNVSTHEIIARTGKATFKKADASAAEDMEALVEAAVATYGRLDMYV
jgi:NAD(P)-dependent dehydrogenase (short-subunit alcohol dehydrogenase family)